MQHVLVIFDLGRTNKKFLLLDRNYHVVEEKTTTIPDTKDEDGDTCEDIRLISKWMKEQLDSALANKDYKIQGINFSAHGASFVHIDSDGNPVTPLYDYMKPLKKNVSDSFYKMFGDRKKFSVATGSPALDMLNSGMQLYLLKTRNPDHFKNVQTSLHLPQYANYLFSRKKHADISSIGCHTGLWDFTTQKYHAWLQEEELGYLLPKPEPVNTVDFVKFGTEEIPVGIGIHDSSAALLPFVKTAENPFVFLSTGTWNITLNPFFRGQLKERKYRRDCLYYLLDIHKKVAASRLFLGNEYEYQSRKLEAHFHKKKKYGENLDFDKKIAEYNFKRQTKSRTFYSETMAGTGPFPEKNVHTVDLSQFKTFEEAYHQMMYDFTQLQKTSIELVCQDIKRLYISGGFVKNMVFMEMLQDILPDWKIYITGNKRASVLGAAVAIHDAWQDAPLPDAVSPVKLFD